MSALRVPWIAGALVLLAGLGPATAAPQIDLVLEPLAAAVGDPIGVRLSVVVGAEESFLTPAIGPAVGPFKVLDGAWHGPEATSEGHRWVWSGHVAVYRPGEHEWPELALAPAGTADAAGWRTPRRSVTIQSVLGASGDDGSAELADIKPPVALARDFRPLQRAGGALALLLLAAGAIGWLHRRFASRFAAAAIPEDPFRRLSAHVWALEELERLASRGCLETGEVDLYYSELARILKLYLGGRYRVDLMERTTAEVPEHLRQAGAGREPIAVAVALLAGADRVKFAGERPGAESARQALTDARRLVETTRPVEPASEADAVRGAA